MLSTMVMVIFFIPNDKKDDTESVEEQNKKIEEREASGAAAYSQKPVTYSLFLKNYEALITLIGCGVVMFLLYFLDTILAVNLEDVFGLTGDTVGYVYIPPMVAFTIFCYVVAKLSKKVEKKVLIVIGFLIFPISYFLIGPSEIMGIPE